jgi:hypothetical protein
MRNEERLGGRGMRSVRRLSILAAIPAVLITVRPAASQSFVDGSASTAPETAPQSRGRDFLFGVPTMTLSLRGGYNFARANSDVFDHTREFLTVNRSDFGAFAISADIGIRATSRLDVLFSFAHAGTKVRSEFRDWLEELPNGESVPIVQSTRFSVTPLSIGMRYYLVPRGREIGRFVWIPASLVPYVGLSVGGAYYNFEQDGDWVVGINDAAGEASIVTDRLASDGWTVVGQAMAGIEYALTPWMALTTEARFQYGNGEPGPDYIGFDGIDLTGLQFTAGLSFRM